MQKRDKKEQIINMLRAGYSYREIQRMLGCTRSNISHHAHNIGFSSPGSAKAAKRYNWQEVQEYYDKHSYKECLHYFGMSNRTWTLAVKAGKLVPHDYTIPLEDLLIENGASDSSTIRRRLRQSGLLDTCCAECGIVEWQGKPLTLELDHINGIHNDHRLENLRWLCPNCHSQTDSYRSKKNGSRKSHASSLVG